MKNYSTLTGPGVSLIMLNPTNINDTEQNLILDLASMSADFPDEDTIVDLGAIAFADKKKPSRVLSAIRTNAPHLQFLARCCLPLIVVLYFTVCPKPPLLVPFPIIIALCILFIAYHIYAYRQIKQNAFLNNDIMTANQIDMAAAHLAWLIDPAVPAPMMMLVAIATIGNGIQNGFASFRALLQITAWAAPLVCILRVQLIGFEPLSLVFVVLCAFLIIYTYILTGRNDRVRLENESRATRL